MHGNGLKWNRLVLLLDETSLLIRYSGVNAIWLLYRGIANNRMLLSGNRYCDITLVNPHDTIWCHQYREPPTPATHNTHAKPPRHTTYTLYCQSNRAKVCEDNCYGAWAQWRAYRTLHRCWIWLTKYQTYIIMKSWYKSLQLIIEETFTLLTKIKHIKQMALKIFHNRIVKVV